MLESVWRRDPLGIEKQTKSPALEKRQGRGTPNAKTESARRNLNSAWTYGSSIKRAETIRHDRKTKAGPPVQSLNLYGYVKNNPTSYADPDGHCCALDDIINFAGGLANAYGSDNLAGAGRLDQTIESGKMGQAVGDFLAGAQGAGEVFLGTGGEIAGTLLSATGAGALLGVPLDVASGALIAHGSTTAAEGAGHLVGGVIQKSGQGPKAADAAGVTAGGQATDKYGNKLGPSGKPQVNETQSNTREGARNKALNEGSGAVEHGNPQKGEPHFHATDNQGRKKPSGTHHSYDD